MKTLAEKEVEAYMGFETTKGIFYLEDVKEHINRALKKIHEKAMLQIKEDQFIDIIFEEEFGELIE